MIKSTPAPPHTNPASETTQDPPVSLEQTAYTQIRRRLIMCTMADIQSAAFQTY